MTELFKSKASPVHGVVLVGHGLNTKPDVMDQIIEVLTRHGFHCLRLSFYDADLGGRTAPSRVVDAWTSILWKAYDEARADYDDLPLHFVGFSLSTVVALSIVANGEDMKFSKMVLLAPPIEVTLLSKVVRVLVPLWRLGLTLPSAAPRAVRARWGTPLNEYGALLDTIESLRQPADPASLKEIPTWILVDEGDELVSHSGVTAWVGRNNLGDWTLDLIQDRITKRTTCRHLIVTKDALGDAAWDQLAEGMIHHLRSGTSL